VDFLAKSVGPCPPDSYVPPAHTVHGTRSRECLETYFARRACKDSRYLAFVKDLCSRVWKMDRVFRETINEDLIYASLHQGDTEFFSQIMRRVQDRLPLRVFSWLREEILQGRLAFDDIESRYAAHALGPLEIADADSSISVAVAGFSRISVQCNAILEFSGNTHKFLDWARRALTLTITFARTEHFKLEKSDGISLVRAAKAFRDFQYMVSESVQAPASLAPCR
jgi:hypothetical protein